MLARGRRSITVDLKQRGSNLVTRLGLDIDPAAQNDQASWPALKDELAAIFRTRTRDEWTELLAVAKPGSA